MAEDGDPPTHASYAVAIIGAGPGGIAAALHLAGQRQHQRIALIDAGHPMLKRYCPADHHRECHGCGGTCNVISGFGGAIHFGDAVKLSRFPSGRRLAECLGEVSADMRMSEVIDLLFQGADQPAFQEARETLRDLSLKGYPVAELTETQVSTLLGSLLGRIQSDRRLELMLGSAVENIEPLGNTFLLRTRAMKPRRRGNTEIQAERVIVAVGRRGQRWWSDQIQQIGVSHQPPTISIGLRFECPRGFFRPAALVHPDLKITQHHRGIKVKTFCLCAGPAGGRIKFTDYGDHTLLDGHVSEQQASSAENIALLAQLHDEKGERRPRAWVKDVLLPRYRALRPDRPGKPVAQWYPDFRARKVSRMTLGAIAQATEVAPSPSDYGVGNLASLLDDNIHGAFCTVFERLMSTLHDNAEDMLSRVTVLGLEIEGLWDEVDVSPNMETSIRHLYAAGDCTGLAQGILQAATAGLVAARACAA